MNAEALLEKYFTSPTALEIVLQHSRLVVTKALRITDSLGRPDIDRRFIEEAALLHDIGVSRVNAPDIGCRGHEPYIRHGIIGREILEAEGLPRHALVCERHIGVGLTIGEILKQGLPLPEREMSPITVEERIVCFADLFYSKSPGFIAVEKTFAKVRNSIGKFGEEKVRIFDSWLREFDISPGCSTTKQHK